MIKQCPALAIVTGVGACVIMAFAPIAGAEDPPCEQQSPEQQQQCQENPGAGVPEQVIDGAKRVGPVKPMIDPQTGKLNPGPTGVRILINGVDTCLPVGVPAPLGADARGVPGDMTGHCILGG